ncbi:MAG: hypothetical protein ACYC61_17180 [Isosphaeraceae bacterium]
MSENDNTDGDLLKRVDRGRRVPVSVDPPGRGEECLPPITPRPEQLVAWVARLDRRLRRVEARLMALAGQAGEQGASIRMICTILKDLDDPYGFGASLDERLGLDPSDGTPDEEMRIGNDPC